jgi:hypothetical protein
MMSKRPKNFVGYIRKPDGRLIQVLHKKDETPRDAITRVLRRHGGRYIGQKDR